MPLVAVSQRCHVLLIRACSFARSLARSLAHSHAPCVRRAQATNTRQVVLRAGQLTRRGWPYIWAAELDALGGRVNAALLALQEWAPKFNKDPVAAAQFLAVATACGFATVLWLHRSMVVASHK